jgi:hypothetical protein
MFWDILFDIAGDKYLVANFAQQFKKVFALWFLMEGDESFIFSHPRTSSTRKH